MNNEKAQTETDMDHTHEDETGAAEESGGGNDKAKIKALRAELDKAKDQMLRALADAENTRKRAIKDRDDAGKYAVANFARDMLEVSDNLRRAIDAVPEEQAATDEHLKALLDGVEATERALLKNFEKHGVHKTEPLGKIFDPNFHEVMFEAPGTGQPPGTVIEVMECGYILHDRLLRPARVGVAKDEGQGGGKNGGGTPAPDPGSNIDTQA